MSSARMLSQRSAAASTAPSASSSSASRRTASRRIGLVVAGGLQRRSSPRARPRSPSAMSTRRETQPAAVVLGVGVEVVPQRDGGGGEIAGALRAVGLLQQAIGLALGRARSGRPGAVVTRPPAAAPRPSRFSMTSPCTQIAARADEVAVDAHRDVRAGAQARPGGERERQPLGARKQRRQRDRVGADQRAQRAVEAAAAFEEHGPLAWP